MAALWIAVLFAPGLASPQADTGKDKGSKEVKMEFSVLISGGDPPKPIRNAEISIMDATGEELVKPKHTDKNGKAKFSGLPKGNTIIVVIAKDWKTGRAALLLDDQQPLFQMSLSRME